MVEPPVRFLAIFVHRLRCPMPRLCSIGHCLLVKIAHRMTPSSITVIEMTVRNGEFPLLFGLSYNFCAIHEVFFFPHSSHSPASADVFSDFYHLVPPRRLPFFDLLRRPARIGGLPSCALPFGLR